MATRNATQSLTRELIAKISPDPRTQRQIENLLKDASTTLPEAAASNAEAAQVAQAAANAAQSTATAAASAAAAAQSDVNAIGDASLIVLHAEPTLDNSRVLAVDPVSLTLHDDGTFARLGSADLASVLATDVTDSSGSFINAGALAVELVANATYLIEALLTMQSAALTTGIGLAFDVPTGSAISGRFSHNVTLTTSEGSYSIADTSVKSDTSSVPVLGENLPIEGRWLVKTTTNGGPAQLQFRTEVGGSAVTLKSDVSALVARRLK